jgi:hypothetical protein
MKFVVWFPRGLDHFIKLLIGFFIPDLSFHILGALVRSKSFIELFMAKVLHENLGMISSLPMLVDRWATFAMLLLCYAPTL